MLPEAGLLSPGRPGAGLGPASWLLGFGLLVCLLFNILAWKKNFGKRCRSGKQTLWGAASSCVFWCGRSRVGLIAWSPFPLCMGVPTYRVHSDFLRVSCGYPIPIPQSSHVHFPRSAIAQPPAQDTWCQPGADGCCVSLSGSSKCQSCPAVGLSLSGLPRPLGHGRWLSHLFSSRDPDLQAASLS